MMIRAQQLGLTLFRVIGAAMVLFIVVGLLTADVTAGAEPSSAERWFASVLLDAKIRSYRPKKLSPLTQADEGWSAAANSTNSNVASAMEWPVAGWRRLPSLSLHALRNS
jgi:hypothetical protein